MDKIPAWLAQTIAALLGLFLLVLTLGQLNTLADKQDSSQGKNTITVSGEGKVEAKPDLANFTASVVSESKNANEARKDASAKMDSVVAYIKQQGVEEKDIKTTDFRIDPRYEYKDGRSEIMGYTATQTVTVKVRKLDSVGTILDGLTEKGVNQIPSVYYSFENPDKLKEEARLKALASAKEKAEKLADTAGVRLGKLVTFSENSYGGPVPPIYYGKSPMAEDAAVSAEPRPASTVQPGTNEITAQVSVTYEVK